MYIRSLSNNYGEQTNYRDLKIITTGWWWRQFSNKWYFLFTIAHQFSTS